MAKRAFQGPLEPARLEWACRLYKRNAEAARDLGVSSAAFGQACRRAGIETPYLRQRRQLKEWRERKANKDSDVS